MWVLVTAVVAAAPSNPPRPKVFAGQVFEVNARQGWFIMQGGASKRYPRVKVLVDKKTGWTGLPRKNRVLKVGDTVYVEAIPAKGGAFRATRLHIQDPNDKPATARPSRF